MKDPSVLFYTADFIETENLRENEKYLINNHNPILNKQWR